MGELTRRELAAHLAMVRTRIRRAQTSQTSLFDTARHVIADQRAYVPWWTRS
ncbi:hypothetical protein ABZ923_12125 [Streptomyces sp. NPDC046881]|uniref:hypothetical protein n=1 Tax=Streptomyces sp. NPDC046881 TaxID=3155374 RepID=UPI0033DD1081